MYPLLRPFLFRLDAERAHELTLSALQWCSEHPGALRLLDVACAVRDERLRVNPFGLVFDNPVGLAAGMDKNAVAVPAWAALGFGAAEVGTLTREPQDGNARPRVFRLKDDHALINRMGFNNEGADAAAMRIRALGSAADPEAARPSGLRLGINVGKSLIASLEEAAEDYRHSLETLWELADYVVLNVSSPNTPGLRSLQERAPLERLLRVAADTARGREKPVLLKIAPDLSEEALLEICGLAEEHSLSGLIATNTTVTRDGLAADPGEAGGLSGLPLRERAAAVLRFLRANTRLPLVAAGGIWSPHDAVSRIRAGASLVQVYTSYVYNGPGLVRRINRAILRELDREGLGGVSELIGIDAPA